MDKSLRPLDRIMRRVRRNFLHPEFRRCIPSLAPSIQHFSHIFPHNEDADSYTLPAYPDTPDFDSNSGLPIPPEKFWANYCTTQESYLQSGLDDTQTMRQLIESYGTRVADLERILELGVAGGRLIRHFADIAHTSEMWGVDCWASAILWCKEHLSPPFNFVTTSVTPHLPFEDRSFALVFAGSVWTHLDDLAEAWTLEIHRILKPGGLFYFTINDRSAVAFFNGGASGSNRKRYIERIRPDSWESWLTFINRSREYQQFARGEATMVTIGRSTQSHVLWDVDYLIKRLGPVWRVGSVTPEAYGHQTGVLLVKA